jgi:hypothetical protein
MLQICACATTQADFVALVIYTKYVGTTRFVSGDKEPTVPAALLSLL